MKNQMEKVPAYRSSEPCCKNDQHHSIGSQWGIAEAEMSMKFHRGERSIPGSHPNTIHLTGIPCPKEEREETMAPQGEGSSSSGCTYKSWGTLNDVNTNKMNGWTDQNSLLLQLEDPEGGEDLEEESGVDCLEEESGVDCLDEESD
jgi:hypothetical protein